MATEDIWDNRDGEMGWNNNDRLVKYRKGTVTNLRAYCRSDNLGVGETTELHRNFVCCVSHTVI